MNEVAQKSESPPDIAQECFRCGYDLRGIADEQPCPECGLLAARSRRATDELHETRPRWLRSISRGSNLILLAILVAVSWPVIMNVLYWELLRWVSANAMFGPPPGWMNHLPLLGLDFAALLLLTGGILLTRAEGYAPADRADAWVRIAVRIAVAIPLLGLLLQHIEIELSRTPWGWTPYGWTKMQIAAVALLTVGLAPLPVLLFWHLRGIAKRARSAHLSEHCLIVGIGTSLAFIYLPVVIFIFENAESWGWGGHWTSRSKVALYLMLGVGVTGILFTMWSLYLLIRFAIAFYRASRRLKQKWKRDDLSLCGSGA